jgi:hypothetical protein
MIPTSSPGRLVDGVLLASGCESSSRLTLLFVPLRLSLCLRDANMLCCRYGSAEGARLGGVEEGEKTIVVILLA